MEIGERMKDCNGVSGNVTCSGSSVRYNYQNIETKSVSINYVQSPPLNTSMD